MEMIDIQKQIDTLMDEVKAAISINTFVLNPDIEKKMATIRELQDICPHEFKDGICQYCYKSEG